MTLLPPFDIAVEHIGAQLSLDRMGERREDEAWIAAQRASPEARVYVLADLKLAVVSDPERTSAALRAFSPAELAGLGLGTGGASFLGVTEDGAPRFSLALSQGQAAALTGGAEALGPLADLRTLALQGAMPPHELALASQARALGAWHAAQRCCGRCGARTEPKDGGWRRECWACGQQHFPRSDPAVIMAVTHEGRCLIGRELRFPENFYSVLAGFVEPGDDIETAVRREIMEEAGVAVGAVHYITSQPWAFPHSLMIGCWAEALSGGIRLQADELQEARWVSRAEASDMLAGRHPLDHTVPQPLSIACTLIRAFAEGKLG